MAGAFLWDDRVATALAITAPVGTPPAGMPVSNLIDPQPRVRARFLGSAAAVLVDFGADVPIEAVALLSTTLGSAATVRRRLWTGDSLRGNRIRNPYFAGVVTGSPGTLPTNSGLSIGSGLSSQVVAEGSYLGVRYIDLRVTGTAAATGLALNFYPDGGAEPVTAGQVWTASAYAQHIAGTLPGALELRIGVYGGAGSFPGGAIASPTLWQLSAQTVTIPSGGTSANEMIWVYCTAGQVVDFTLRVAAPRFELGASATLPMAPEVEQPAGAAALLLDTGAVSADTSAAAIGAVVMLDASATSGRYLRLDISDGAASQIDIGRLVAGPVWRLARAFAYGVQEGRLILDRRDRNPFTAAEFAVPALANPRATRFALPLLSAAEILGQHRAMLRAMGAAGDALWIPDVGLSRAEMNTRSIWGAVAEAGAGAMVSRDSPAGSSRSFTITERV